MAGFNDSYQGAFDALEDWAEQFLEDSGALKDAQSLRYYIDVERRARDAELTGDIFALEFEDSIHVFWN